MLAKILNAGWSEGRTASIVMSTRICSESESIRNESQGMPCDLIRAAVRDLPLKVLTRLGEFAAGGPAVLF